MSWMRMLCDTYDQNQSLIANYTSDNPLCPLSHMETSSQIEITIDVNGNFREAQTITEREDAQIFIPVTEESAGRSSGDAPHPLCDNLTYTAGDYSDFANSKKEADSSKKRFEKYIAALELWKDSLYTHEKVQGVYNYLSKKCMIKDLVKSGIIVLSESGTLSKEKIAGKPYDKCIVRFQIRGSEPMSACWQDKLLIEKYQKYYEKQKKETSRLDRCYLSGEYGVISDNHPKGILAASYGAKLISANDNTDFTFRGRFKNGEEAYAVSYESTQKVHNALKWLAKQQGYTIGNSDKRTYICWCTKGKLLPQLGAWDEYDEDDIRPTTKPAYKQKLMQLINGYKDNFDDTDDIALMALEAATTGRLSIVYYNEMKAKDFFERVRNWNETCCWEFTTFDKSGNPIPEVKTPSIKHIVENAFGVQQDKLIKVNDKLMIMQYQRLYHCIVDNQRMPRDFVEAIFQKASRPLGYSRGNRERVLSTACALIAKFYEGENIDMALDKNQTDRSYLYGRLLAVFERVERSTYDKDEKREPNAIRLQSAYVQHPATTRAQIEEALIPYYQNIKNPALREFYRQEIEEISNKMEIDLNNGPLSYLYLIGYWAERAELRKPKSERV